MTSGKWIFSVVIPGVLILIGACAARADIVVLKDGQEIHGKLRLEGALAAAPDSSTTSISPSMVKQVRVSGRKVLFLMKDGGWVECQFVRPDLILDKDGLWQIVSVASIVRIQFEPETGPEVALVLKGAEGAAPRTPVPSPVPRAPVPSPAQPRPVEEGLPEMAPGEGPETLSLETAPRVSAAKKEKAAEERKPGWVSPEGGYTLILGEDRNALQDGPSYGLSFGYELFRRLPWYVGPEFSFLRSSHAGQGFMDGVTQYTNSLGFGIRGGYAFSKVDCYAKLQIGPVFLDSSSGQAGKNTTFFGFQAGLGADYHILPWLTAGPEARITEAAGKTSWISLLAKASVRF